MTRNGATLASLLLVAPLAVLECLALTLAFLWVGLVSDQMPCFLGVPNCD